MKTQLDVVRAQRNRHLADLHEACQLLERIDALAAQILAVDTTSQPAADIREAINNYFNLGTA